MKKTFWLLILQAFLFVNQMSGYEYQLVIGAIFRNEAPYLKEWIEFHKLVGVEHFYLYNNGSTDTYEEVLAPYVQAGDVDLINWPFRDETFQGFCFNIQPRAYEDCIELVKGNAKWLALIDVDEFLTPLEGSVVTDVLNDYESFGGLVVNWQLFGTSGVSFLPSNKTLVETLVLKAAIDHPNIRYYKSIIRPECALSCPNPHMVYYKPGFYAVNVKKKPIGCNQKFVPPHLIKLVLNHYWTRTEDYCYGEKLQQYQRWNPNYERKTLEDYVKTLNSVRDHTMEKFIAPLRERMGFESDEGDPSLTEDTPSSDSSSDTEKQLHLSFHNGNL
jgi:hypothetical protein